MASETSASTPGATSGSTTLLEAAGTTIERTKAQVALAKTSAKSEDSDSDSFNASFHSTMQGAALEDDRLLADHSHAHLEQRKAIVGAGRYAALSTFVAGCYIYPGSYGSIVLAVGLSLNVAIAVIGTMVFVAPRRLAPSASADTSSAGSSLEVTVGALATVLGVVVPTLRPAAEGTFEWRRSLAVCLRCFPAVVAVWWIHRARRSRRFVADVVLVMAMFAFLNSPLGG